jgi:putative aldouronate transport system permease protein
MKNSVGRNLFQVVNYTFLIVIGILCLLPIINVLSISFSSSIAASSGAVKLWPVDFNIESYKYALTKPEFMQALFISIERTVIATAISMTLTILAAYPLSKEKRDFPMRTVYAWFFFVTTMFSGGLIPWYMQIKHLGLIDTIWALVLPGAVTVFNVILLLNFVRGLPKEMMEAAFIDGAGHWRTLWSVVVPVSTPAIATLVLFTCVGNWNSWFDGLILMSDPKHYPLQTYLQTLIVSRDPQLLSKMSAEDMKSILLISDRTIKASQIFLASLPILVVYPFLQKYFLKGIVLGSVKG